MAFDPDEFLSGKKKPDSGATTTAPTGGFDPDAFVNAPIETAEPALVADTPVPTAEMSEPGVLEALGAISPAVMGSQIVAQGGQVGLRPTGLSTQLSGTQVGQMAQNAGRIMQPYATAASKVAGQYMANPLTKLAPDLAALSAGIPPPIASAQALGATQGAYNVGRQIAQGKAPGPVAPSVSTGFPAPEASRIVSNPALSEMAARQAALQTESLTNRTMIQKLAMNKVLQNMGQVAAPALNTAARIAGPAGMAMNLYDAGQMARETELGSRLAQGQGQRAPQAFRQMNVPYGSGFAQNITQQQAQNILAAGSPRDIEAFGGTELLRKKALGI
jgi:hypothetical protein